MDRRVGTRMLSSMQTMAWLHCRTHVGSRLHLVTWSDCLIGWACGLMSGRQLACSDAHARRGGTQLEAAYWRRITGVGPTYLDQQKGRVQCRECYEEVTTVSLAGHKMTQHGRAAEARRSWKTSSMREELRMYCMDFPAKGGP